MRSGRLLAEESPDSLMVRHNLTSLEDVFLSLCRKDVNEKNGVNEVSNTNRSSMRHRQRQPAVVTNGKNPASGFHQGVDNPAFAQNFHRPDALPGDDDDKDASNNDQKSTPPTVVSSFWKFFSHWLRFLGVGPSEIRFLLVFSSTWPNYHHHPFTNSSI